MGKVSAKTRKKTQTLPGGRFPMPDREHARKALQMLPKAKGLSAADKTKIRNRANKMLYGTTSPSKQKKKGGK